MASPQASRPTVRSWYDQLGVQRSATDGQIRRAFRMQALRWHPDKCSAPDAAEQFRKVTEAFKILSSEAGRREHDAQLDVQLAQSRAPAFPKSPTVREPIAAFLQLLGTGVPVAELRAWSARCGLAWPDSCLERAELLAKLRLQAEDELDRRVRRRDWPELQKADLVAWLEARGCSMKFASDDDAVDKKKLIQLVSGHLTQAPWAKATSPRRPAETFSSERASQSPAAASRAASPPTPAAPVGKPSTPRKSAGSGRQAKGAAAWAAFRPLARPAAEPKPKAQRAKATVQAPRKPKPKKRPHSDERCARSSRPRPRSADGPCADADLKQSVKAAKPKQEPASRKTVLPCSSSSSESSYSSKSSESSESSASSEVEANAKEAPAKAKTKATPTVKLVKPPPANRGPRSGASELSGDRAKLEELRRTLEALREAKREPEYPKALPVLRELKSLDEQGRITWKLLQQSRLYTELNRVFWRQQVHGASFGLAGALLAKWVRCREEALKKD